MGSPEKDAAHGIALTLVWGTAFVVYCFITLGLRDLWRNRTKPMIKKRYMMLAILTIVGSVGMVFGVNLAVFINSKSDAEQATTDTSDQQVKPHWFIPYVIVMYALSVYTIVCSVLARLWLICYDMSYARLIGDKVWITLISKHCTTRRQLKKRQEQEAAKAERLEKIKQKVRPKSPIPSSSSLMTSKRSSTLRTPTAIEQESSTMQREESMEVSVTDTANAGSFTRSASAVPFWNIITDDWLEQSESNLNTEDREIRQKRRLETGVRPVRSFWCKYKSTLGNPYLIIHLILPLTILILSVADVCVFMFEKELKLYFYWQSGTFVILFTLCAAVKYKIPRMSDGLRIYQEMKWMINLAGLAIGFIMCLWILPFWLINDDELRQSWPYIWVATACVNLAMVSFSSTPVFLPLYYLLSEKREMEQRRSSLIPGYKPILISLIVSKFIDFWSVVCDKIWEHIGFPIHRFLWQIENNAFDMTCSLGQCTKLKQDLAIKDGVPGVLSRRESLSLFMNHLINEFSTENMLALIEFVHFRVRFRTESNHTPASVVCSKLKISCDSDTSEKGDLSDLIGQTKWYEVISEDIPLPTLVWNEEADAYSVVNSLVEKYVASGSEFELNLSYPTRTKIMEVTASMAFMDRSLTDDELALIFDVAISECMTLMKDSFQRWNRTPDFERYALHIGAPTVEAVRENKERSKKKTASSADLSVSPAVHHVPNASPSSTVDYSVNGVPP